jgi:hypothetical protein
MGRRKIIIIEEGDPLFGETNWGDDGGSFIREMKSVFWLFVAGASVILFDLWGLLVCAAIFLLHRKAIIAHVRRVCDF